jgi:hypothetical protein
MNARKPEIKIKSLKELSLTGKNAFFSTQYINTDLEPTCESYMRVVEHLKMGQVELSKLRLFYSKEQLEFPVKGGAHRRSLFKNALVMNATAWDKFSINPKLIPDSWKKDKNGEMLVISFFGTIFSHPNGSLYVRIMFFDENENKWHFGDSSLCDYWESANPVVIIGD